MKINTLLKRILLVLAAVTLLGTWLWHIPHSLLGVPGSVGFTVCHQIHSHSFSLGEWQFPLCARCSGMYLGTAVGLGFFLPKGKKAGLPPRQVIILLLVYFFTWAGDGLNAFVHEYLGASLYAPSNVLRFVTGSAMGMTLSIALLSVLNTTLWSESQPQGIVTRPAQLILPLAITLALGGLLLLQTRIVFVLLTYMSIAAVISVVTLLHTNIWVLLLRKENTFSSWKALSAMLILGFCTAQAQFILMAAGRMLLTGGWIIH